MEPTEATIEALRVQERALDARIHELEEAMLASSTPGIREFRRTRLSHLEDQRAALGDRLSRIGDSTTPAVEAYLLGNALRNARLAAQGAFGG